MSSRNFVSLLHCSARSPEISEAADIYGCGWWEAGSLTFCTMLALTSRRGASRGEVHFGWVLEGRAIQDVWITPGPSDRRPGLDQNNNMYGTTLRVWDASIQAWRIRWINPVSGHEERQTGRKIGNDIVQIGARADGTPTRWRFTEITSDRFHWLGEALSTDGTSWRLEGEFLARRLR